MLVLSGAVILLVIDCLGRPLDYDYEQDHEHDWKYEYDYACLELCRRAHEHDLGDRPGFLLLWQRSITAAQEH